ncbi:MAG: hypothetical protein CL933_11530 [Deltaproteobacteria bacterium]|nr:hypothetical protein [Deltaproteobacteria bacterium]
MFGRHQRREKTLDLQVFRVVVVWSREAFAEVRGVSTDEFVTASIRRAGGAGRLLLRSRFRSPRSRPGPLRVSFVDHRSAFSSVTGLSGSVKRKGGAWPYGQARVS